MLTCGLEVRHRGNNILFYVKKRCKPSQIQGFEDIERDSRQNDFSAVVPSAVFLGGDEYT
jgi:hypothetical protein